MISIIENKLNLLFGDVDSAKTTVILNSIIQSDNNVLLFTPDTEADHLEKKIHCLHNDVDMSTIKHDSNTLKPKGLELPTRIQVIDNCREFEDIKSTISELSRGVKPDLIVLDNINQIDFGIKNVSYKERINKMFTTLSNFAQDNKVTILASFYMLKIANWEESEDFTEEDEKLGSFTLIERKGRDVNVLDVDNDSISSYKINPRNLKLETT